MGVIAEVACTLISRMAQVCPRAKLAGNTLADEVADWFLGLGWKLGTTALPQPPGTSLQPSVLPGKCLLLLLPCHLESKGTHTPIIAQALLQSADNLATALKTSVFFMRMTLADTIIQASGAQFSIISSAYCVCVYHPSLVSFHSTYPPLHFLPPLTHSQPSAITMLLSVLGPCSLSGLTSAPAVPEASVFIASLPVGRVTAQQ